MHSLTRYLILETFTVFSSIAHSYFEGSEHTPVMNVTYWCVAFIRIYRIVRVLGVNIINKLIHYVIDIFYQASILGFFLKWLLVAKNKNMAITINTWSHLSQKYPLPVSHYFTLSLNSSHAFYNTTHFCLSVCRFMRNEGTIIAAIRSEL